MNSIKTPLVSVFIPFYNDQGTIADCLKSIIKQSYKNLEIILFNHCSTDHSLDIIKTFRDKRITIINGQRNLGAGSGLNLQTCWKYINGKYLKLFCADDVMKDDCIETLVNFLEKHNQIDFCFSDMEICDKNLSSKKINWSTTQKMYDPSDNSLDTLKKLFKGYSYLPYSTVLVRTSDFPIEDVNTTLISLFDFSLWQLLLLKNKKIGFIKKVLVNYRTSETQLSAINDKNELDLEYYEIVKKFYQITDYEFIKILCPCPYTSKNEIKGLSIPFIISYYYLVHGSDRSYFYPANSIRSIIGYDKLFELMENKATREEISNFYNFHINDFRKLYSRRYDEMSNNYFLKNTKLVKFLKKILLKRVMDLSYIQTLLVPLIRPFKFLI